MPRLCSFGCKPSDATMHSFPNYAKFPDRFKVWVDLCGGKLETPADYEYYRKKKVCDKHFTDRDRNRYKRLNALAVPSLYLSGIKPNQDLQKTLEDHAAKSDLSTSETPVLNMLNISEVAETRASVSQLPMEGTSLHKSLSGVTKTSETQASTSKPSTTGNKFESKNVLREHNYTAASKSRLVTGEKTSCRHRKPVFNYTIIKSMRGQISRLRGEICRLKKNGDFHERLSNANKLSQSTTFKQVVERMPKPTQLFISMQMQGMKNPKGRRFSIEEKVLSLSLFKKSPKGYAHLHKYFTLPSVKAMKRLLSKIKLTPGINPIIFEKIKHTVSTKDVTDRLCSLAFDEMSITPQVNYNLTKDVLEGFAFNNENQFADHALVFMVKGIEQNYKQPIAYYFTHCLKTVDLKKLIKTVIRHAQESGLIIVNTVCDQSSVNVSAINELVADTKAAHLRAGKEWRYDCFSVNGRKIIPLFDTPHLIKGIRNNLLTKDMLYTVNNEEKVVKWEYFQKVYHADKSYGELKMLHKLTEEHINPDKINKMRVKTATQIFSHKVAVATEHLTGRGDLPTECRQLIDITVLINNLFDSLNVSSYNVPDGKIYKGAVKRSSPHHKLWKEGKKVLKTVKFIQKKSTGNKIRLVETSIPSITNLIRTIDGMEAIWHILSTTYGLNALLTRHLNQDPVENFFGNIRSYGARNNAPTTVAFEGAFKALLLNNYSTPHSRRANCEEDTNECLQNLDFFVKDTNMDLSKNQTSDVPEETYINEEIVIDVDQVKDDAGQKNYVCGWVITKCLKNVCKSCQQCRETLLESEAHKNKNNSYIKKREYQNKAWLCYPSEQTENCFHEIQKITTSVLKKNVPKKNLKKKIVEICNIFVDYPFRCAEHCNQLQIMFVNTTVNVLIYSWCKTVNRILSGKILYVGEEEVKSHAAVYYNKHRNYKNRK